MKNVHCLAIIGALATSANAATIVTGDVTANLGPNFFFDAAVIGGGDFGVNQPSSGIFNRSFGTLNVGSLGSTINITGIGWASPNNASGNDATSATVAITYLGADGAFGGGDDVLIGTATDNYTFAGAAGEYYWSFTTPMVQTIDGANTMFRIAISPTNATNNGSLTFKTDAGGAKLSVAGTSVALIPEPSTALLGALGMLALLRRRR